MARVRAGAPFDFFLTNVPAGAAVGVQITDLELNEVVRARTTNVRRFAPGTAGNPSAGWLCKVTLVAPTRPNTTLFLWWDVNGEYGGEELILEPL